MPSVRPGGACTQRRLSGRGKPLICLLVQLAMLQGDKYMSWRAVVCLVPARLHHAAARDACMQAAPFNDMSHAMDVHALPCHAMFGPLAAAMLCHA